MKTERSHDIGLLVARTMLGTVMIAHGSQKLLGWFGGYGYDSSVAYFTDSVGLPYLFAVGIILLESIGMVALIAGLATRLVSIALALVMVGAIVVTHHHFFFMNWFGAQAGEGYEYHLLVVALTAMLAFNGSGKYAADHYIRKRLVQRSRFAFLFT